MKNIKKSIALLTLRERKMGLIVLVLVIGMAMLETIGIASVMPFLAVFGDPKILDTNPVLKVLYTEAQSFGIHTPDDFLILLGISAFTLMIISAAYRTFTQYVMNHYVEMRRHSISMRLLETYLRQPYAFFLQRPQWRHV